MEDQGRKRKADAVLPKMESPPTHKSPRLLKKETPDIIVIDDDDLPSTHPAEGTHLTGRRKRGREAQPEWTHDKERMQDLGNIVGNLRDQVTEWTLRVQQSETLFETLRVKMGNLPSTAWQEDMRKITSEEVRPLIERIERLENSRVGHHHAGGPPPSTHGASKTAFKTPFTQSDADGVSPNRSIVDENLTYLNSTTSEDRAYGGGDITTQIKDPSDEKAGVRLDVLSDLGISATGAFWKPPELSNKGLKKLLQKVDLRNMEHLRALNTLDNCTMLRDCILFCDTHITGGIQADYILRTGTTVNYIRDPGAVVRDQQMELHRHGLGGLRIHQLDIIYSADDAKDKDRFRAWMKDQAPPKYVYDVGQLFLRRRIRDRYELNGSHYNIVVDITKPQKPVWLVMRPEYDSMFRTKSDKNHTPFSRSLNGVGIAKIADALEELSFCRDPFDVASFEKHSKAEKLISNTSFRGVLTRRFLIPNIGEMQAKITAGWGATEPR